MKDFNRLKLVLVERKKTGKWLAEGMGRTPATISKWCTNTSQPNLEELNTIAQLLDVEVTELLVIPKHTN